jgi:hypothetical protein
MREHRIDYRTMPDELPENPKGWTQELIVHLNFGGAGGSASYKIVMPDKTVTPIFYEYDTRKGGSKGFSLPGIKSLMSWKELRSIWPTWIDRARKKQATAAELT